MKKATLIMVMFLAACTKVATPPTPTIDLGVVPQSTIGAKYSVQIVPFGSEEPVKKDGFTADNTTTKKVYDLSSLKRMDYDLIFIDISGKEIKYPLIIK